MKMFGLLAISFGLLLLSARVQATDVSAEHGNDMVHVGKSIDVAASEAVGDAVCVGCSIHIAGRASGDLVAVGGSVQVEGTVQGDAVVVGGNLRLEPGAVIHGDVSVVGGRLQRDPAARIDGEVSTPSLHGGAGALVLVLLVPLLAMLLIGILLVVLCVAVLGEGRIEIVVEALRRHTGLGLLAGLGVIVGFLVLISVFHWTGPLSPIVSVGLFLALLAMAVVGYSGVAPG